MKGSDTPAIMTIKDFCDHYRISRSFYAKLRSQGKGPTEIKIGAAVRISKASADDWLRTVERRYRTMRPPR